MAQTSPGRGRRGGREPRYTVEQVMATAVELLDAEGLQSFSMRRLADALGTSPMTLYGYVRTKEEILDGVLAICLQGVLDDVDIEAPWDRQVTTAIRDLHGALRAHPGALELLLAKPAPSPHLDLVREALVGILRRAGFADAVVWEAEGMLGSFAIGFAVSESSHADVGAAVDRLRALDDRLFPNLSALAGGYPSHLSDAAFTRGLEYIVEGLRRELGSAMPAH